MNRKKGLAQSTNGKQPHVSPTAQEQKLVTERVTLTFTLQLTPERAQ